MTGRPCTRCGRVQPAGEFARDRSTPDGLRRICRTCAAALMRAWRTSPDGRDRFNATARRYKAANPEKERARLALRRAVRAGRVRVHPCAVGIGCAGRLEAHHPDYARPLEVVWLCRRHHEALHHQREAAA